MPSNNTENIYATQYGGEGEPIPATKISYDGTGTSISATTVQAAITELDTDLQSTKEDVTDITTELRDTWVKVGLEMSSIKKVADGVKTIGDLFAEVASDLAALLLTLEDDEALVPRILFVSGKAWMGTIGTDIYTNETASFGPVFSRVNVTASLLSAHFAKLSSTSASNEYYTSQTVAAGTTTFINQLEVVATEGSEVTLTYEIYKKSLG